ncbi:phosphatase PAP2 family protein [Streptomyces spirodelae]|uniref:Phosphatase PAP2 family protein n=1 Tax=Streptomyces spirodelae TaxID=2812904 RepID=A0ABS3X284_9ACTN|nr:phosphatase PAP2 family protein [Streptomyces spirodelae]MBO8189493.1 phosphatase PAP2 family protein [Streptomyces spirodelae]
MSGQSPLEPAEAVVGQTAEAVVGQTPEALVGQTAEAPEAARTEAAGGAPAAAEPVDPRRLLKRLAPVPVPVPPGSETRPRRAPDGPLERSARTGALPWGAALLASLLLFAVISFAVCVTGAGFVDRPVLNAAVQHRQAALDGPLTYVSHASNGPLLVCAVLLALWLSWRDASWRPLLLVGGVGALSIVAATVAKELSDRARPPARLWEISESGFCYPSRHTVVATAVLLGLAYVLAARIASRAARAALWTGAVVLSLLAGASRVYLGVHWPTDVLAGLTLGAAVMLVVVVVHVLCATRGARRVAR